VTALFGKRGAHFPILAVSWLMQSLAMSCRSLFVLSFLLLPLPALAQMKPHRAVYVLRLGAAANAPRIGMAVQDITFDCKKWRIVRNVVAEVPFTPSLKIAFSSKLDGEESVDGEVFRYHSVEVQNGTEHVMDGAVQKVDGEIHVELLSADGALHLALPPSTLMPVAALNFLISRLVTGVASFQRPVFGAEATGEAFLLDVKQLDENSVRPLPPTIKPVPMSAQKCWPISMAGKRTLGKAPASLFLLRGRMFESGVIDRLTVDTGIAVVAVDLEALEMHPEPTCSQ
jgi:hypothetical protein